MMNMIDKIIPKMAESHIYISPTATPWGIKNKMKNLIYTSFLKRKQPQ